MSTQALYTIGHSHHPLATLTGHLRAHAIEVLCDVRSQPYSRYAPQFDRRSLEAGIVAAGLKYLFLGRELGGRPEGDEFYDSDGRVLYSCVAASALFLDGIARLEKGIGQYRVAILCSEEDPAGCHRRLLVGRVLAERGVRLLHIRGDSSVQVEEEFGEQRAPNPGDQLALFPDQEVREWKSIRSVLPKRQPATSSEP